MRVGIAEVAQVAGVSDATVSRVINGRRGVAAQTRAAVHEAMQQLGFERKIVSQIVPVVTYVTDPAFQQMFDLLEVRLAAVGLQPVLVPASREGEYINALVDLGICGVVFLSAESNTGENSDLSSYRLLESRHLPYVTVNGLIDDSAGPAFSTDDRVVSELAVRHLWGLGHRRIGLATGPAGDRPADRRLEGFTTTMRLLGDDDPEDLIVRQSYSIEGGQAAAERLLDKGATAIVAASDAMALGAVRAARRRGLRIPDQISVIGSNDATILDFTDPPLTSVRLPVGQLCAAVAHAITELVNGREVPLGEVLFQPELIVRGSTGAVRPAQG